jgi:integrase
MTQPNSSDPSPCKPAKPREDFPLFPHATGRWAKKIRGKLHYFGKWDNPDAAIEKYNREKEDLHAGRKVRDENQQGRTVKDMCDWYWNIQKSKVSSGELTPRSLQDCDRIAKLIVAHFGRLRVLSDIRPDDFAALRVKLSKRLGLVALKNEIIRVRCVFNFAYDVELLDKPIRYGAGFALPSKKTLRREKATKGKKMFEADEIRRMLDKAPQPLRAMILLGINCAFGNADCGTLPLAAVDLQQGWINYPRPKTGIDRRCPLWPETIEALKEAIAERPEPRDERHAGLVFITKYRDSWHKETSDEPISKETRKLLDSLEINGSRNFYALRHTFQTIGDDSGKPHAVRHIMGHASDDISAEYRERVSDESLRAAAEFVRAWLFPPAAKKTGKKAARA